LIVIDGPMLDASDVPEAGVSRAEGRGMSRGSVRAIGFYNSREGVAITDGEDDPEWRDLVGFTRPIPPTAPRDAESPLTDPPLLT
jgi:hypothetical protein